MSLNQATGYLVVQADPRTFQIHGVSIFSEAPWTMTRVIRGPGREIMTVLHTATCATFGEAMEHLYKVYPILEPDLARAFPLPDVLDPNDDETVVLKMAEPEGTRL